MINTIKNFLASFVSLTRCALLGSFVERFELLEEER